jgi:hypothetical protein
MANQPNKPAASDDQIRSVDILAMEFEQDLPYWLDPAERYSGTPTREAIREKHRAKYVAEQKAKQKPKG